MKKLSKDILSEGRPKLPADLRIGDYIRNFGVPGYVTDNPQILVTGEVTFHLADRWEKGLKGVKVWVSPDRELELIQRRKNRPYKK